MEPEPGFVHAGFQVVHSAECDDPSFFPRDIFIRFTVSLDFLHRPELYRQV